MFLWFVPLIIPLHFACTVCLFIRAYSPQARISVIVVFCSAPAQPALLDAISGAGMYGAAKFVYLFADAFTAAAYSASDARYQAVKGSMYTVLGTPNHTGSKSTICIRTNAASKDLG